jgi:hypothetical protein
MRRLYFCFIQSHVTNAKSLDKSFFDEQHIVAKTNGKNSTVDFKRVTSFNSSGATDRPPKKSHKKGKKNQKIRTKWTAED